MADECRPVTLPSGETIRVRGAEPMTGQDMAALGVVIAAARRLMPDPDPAELYARLDEARSARVIFWRTLAKEAGVHAPVLTRLANGVLPNAEDRAKLDQWLQEEERDA